MSRVIGDTCDQPVCSPAPFLPKLAMLAKSNLALAVGAMVRLMVVTIGYAPIAVPLAVEGATVDPLAIAQSPSHLRRSRAPRIGPAGSHSYLGGAERGVSEPLDLHHHAG